MSRISLKNLIPASVSGLLLGFFDRILPAFYLSSPMLKKIAALHFRLNSFFRCRKNMYTAAPLWNYPTAICWHAGLKVRANVNQTM